MGMCKSHKPMSLSHKELRASVEGDRISVKGRPGLLGVLHQRTEEGVSGPRAREGAWRRREGGEEGDRVLSRVMVVKRGWDRLLDT